jgi:hypothetical protein
MASAAVNAVLAELDALVVRIVQQFTLEVHANLVEATPVDTGWARASWVPALGGPPADVATPESREDRIAAAAGRNVDVNAVISSYKFPALVYVSNGVPDIRKLNDGHSAQAPADFVQGAIDQARVTLGGR